MQEAGLHNVEIVEQDAYHTDFPRESFELVHVRFVFAPVARDEDLLGEMVALTKPGGIVAIQEPDATCWNCFPLANVRTLNGTANSLPRRSAKIAFGLPPVYGIPSSCKTCSVALPVKKGGMPRLKAKTSWVVVADQCTIGTIMRSHRADARSL